MVDKKTLAGLELFVDLPDRALDAIAALAERKRYAPAGTCSRPSSITSGRRAPRRRIEPQEKDE